VEWSESHKKMMNLIQLASINNNNNNNWLSESVELPLPYPNHVTNIYQSDFSKFEFTGNNEGIELNDNINQNFISREKFFSFFNIVL
jgi:hypothetical protein